MEIDEQSSQDFQSIDDLILEAHEHLHQTLERIMSYHRKGKGLFSLPELTIETADIDVN